MSQAKPRIVVGPGARRPALLLWVGIGALLAGAAVGFLLSRLVLVQPSPRFAEQAQALERAGETIARLQQELAIAQRGGQVTGAANDALRDQVAAREERIADLESDVAFYRRLLGSGGSQKGLAVHALQLSATNAPDVYRYQLTLSQNLNQAKIVAGEYELQAEGVLDGSMVRLDSAGLEMLPAAGEPRFEFKYFQELRGSLRVPEGFVPDSLVVQLTTEELDEPVARHFDWRQLTGASVPEAG
ncbi:MAG: DUF6776 family protein [Xanthomonadales bacterium]|nr:DUF6776 family protein [Xanthomonadales bacterium]